MVSVKWKTDNNGTQHVKIKPVNIDISIYVWIGSLYVRHVISGSNEVDFPVGIRESFALGEPTCCQIFLLAGNEVCDLHLRAIRRVDVSAPCK